MLMHDKDFEEALKLCIKQTSLLMTEIDELKAKINTLTIELDKIKGKLNYVSTFCGCSW